MPDWLDLPGQRLFELWRLLAQALPGEYDWLALVAVGLALALLARGIGRLRCRALAGTILQHVRDSNPHPVQVHAGPDGRGFVVESNPAPEPFAQVMVLYTPDSRIDPVGMMRWLLRHDAHTLRVRAMFHEPPRAELIFRKGIDIGRVLTADDDRSDWVSCALDFNLVQYSTRGVDPVALEHAFADFQTRFGPILREFSVRSRPLPHVEVVLGAPRLAPITVAAFLISLRGVGRAARS